MNISKRIPADPQNLYQYIRNAYNDKKVICAYEAGGTGYHLHDYLSEHQTPCLMVSPPSIPKAPNDRVKNNRLDSERITSHMMSKDIHPIRVPESVYRELRHLLRCREDYVDSGKVAKQRIKALLLFAHLYEHIKEDDKNWSYRYIHQLALLPCEGAVRQRLNMLLEDLHYARTQNIKVLKEIKSLCLAHPDLQQHLGYLRSIPGVGVVTAISILGYIGNPIYLRNVRELGSFTGLVPREHSSGNSTSRGSITHLGSPLLRSLLIEAAWRAKASDKHLGMFFARIHARHHPKIASRKAIVAVARKLTMIIYKVLKEQRNYINSA